MHALQRLALASLLGTSTVACSTLELRAGESLEVSRSAEFRQGVTSRGEVLATFGAPTGVGTHADGFALLYEELVLEESQLGLGLDFLGALLGAQFFALFKVSLGESGSGREAILFLFDEEGLLCGIAQGEWGEKYGRGGGLQVLFNVEQVVNSGDLRRTPAGMTWGRALLEPLPETLNRAHLADVEQRGWPSSAGQRTLEQRPDVGR